MNKKRDTPMAAAILLSIAAFMTGAFNSAGVSPPDVLISNFASILAGAGAVVKITGATVVVSSLLGRVDVVTSVDGTGVVVSFTGSPVVVVSCLLGRVDVLRCVDGTGVVVSFTGSPVVVNAAG